MENILNDSDYSQPPADKAELMQRIEREWSALQHAIAGLSEARMVVPDAGGWSIKDNLAHLAEWERFMRLYHLQGQPPHAVMGVDEATFEGLDEDGENDILFRRNRERTVSEVLDNLRRSHELVLADLGAMSFEELMQPHYEDDPEKRPLINGVIGNTYDHYREHRAAIEKLVGKTAQ